MSATASVRRAHRVIGLAVGAFLVSSGATGLLWAYAPFLYWQPGYLEPKSPVVSPPLDSVTVGVRDALRKARATLAGDVRLASVVLRSDAGRLLYEVQYRAGQGPATVLVDGQTGEILSPLDEQIAVAIAREYVRGAPAVKAIARLDDYVPRAGPGPVPVYRIAFRQPGDPTIFIHRDTGRIVEDEDRVRRFHFFVMRLHQLSFFGFRKTLTAIPGLALLAMVVSGAVVWLGPRLRRARRRAAEI